MEIRTLKDFMALENGDCRQTNSIASGSSGIHEYCHWGRRSQRCQVALVLGEVTPNVTLISQTGERARLDLDNAHHHGIQQYPASQMPSPGFTSSRSVK